MHCRLDHCLETDGESNIESNDKSDGESDIRRICDSAVVSYSKTKGRSKQKFNP